MGVVDVAQPVDVLVAGGGGFIGGHLVADLLSQGLSVRSVDVNPLRILAQPSTQSTPDAEALNFIMPVKPAAEVKQP